MRRLPPRVQRVSVYARMDPAQKIRIVRALQAQGQFVAMTGDGVNDAPALRSADIGVAMGRGGTDVAREASSLVLLDDNFATIVGAVREGRRIFDNIRKFIRYALTGNSGEIWVLFLAPLLGMPIPLLPIHILWVNLVTDGLPGLALAAEPAERGVMQRPPRPPQESVFAHGLWQHALWVGLLIGALCLGVQAWALRAGADEAANAHWQTMVFTVLTFAQMAHLLAIRSERESLFTSRPGEQPATAGGGAADARAAAGDDLCSLAAARVSHPAAFGCRAGLVFRSRRGRVCRGGDRKGVAARSAHADPCEDDATCPLMWLICLKACSPDAVHSQAHAAPTRGCWKPPCTKGCLSPPTEASPAPPR